MKNFTMKELWLLLCCLMAVSAIHAQNYSKKVKNAKGIEVTYQSSYKGKVRPGYLLMMVSTDRVSLENKRAESKQPNDNQVRPEDKTPVTGSYIDRVWDFPFTAAHCWVNWTADCKSLQ